MIYADYNATAPMHSKVKTFLQKRMEGVFANPNALHALGVQVKEEIQEAREAIADMLGAFPEQVFFTSSSTEGLNTVFQQFYYSRRHAKILTSHLEHTATVSAVESLAQFVDVEVLWTKATEEGLIENQQATSLIKNYGSEIGLACFMSANHEVGTLQPLDEILDLCAFHKIPFLCDTTQHVGRIPFHFKNSKLHYAVLSGHKLGAPLGSGVLLVKDSTSLTPMIWGGGQESGLRGGTQNYLGILALRVALEEELNNGGSSSLEKKWQNVVEEKELFEQRVLQEIPGSIIFGRSHRRLPNTSLISFPGLHGQAVQIECESKNIFFTTSSACSDNEPETSKILKAMNVSDRIGRGAFRISTGHSYQLGDYQKIFQALKAAYQHLSH